MEQTTTRDPTKLKTSNPTRTIKASKLNHFTSFVKMELINSDKKGTLAHYMLYSALTQMRRKQTPPGGKRT